MSRRRRPKKTPDAVFVSPPPAPSSEAPRPPPEPDESVLTRVLLTPLLFTSFLLSLFLVNRKDRARRAETHSPRTSLRAWLDPEPYQDAADSSWGRRPVPDTQRPYWHLHKKMPSIARLEISDAFELRKTVLVLMGVVGCALVLALCLGLGWMARRVWP